MKQTKLRIGLVAILAVCLAGWLGCGDKKDKAAAKKTVEGTQVGNSAPEIEGNDLDKVAFKLSDYRGKVVMLDFWAGW